MATKLLTQNILLGVISWLIPFAASFLFFKPGGEMLVPYATFKSIISVVGTLSGCFLLLRYFRYVEKDHVQNGVIVGLSWMVINFILDAAFLMPMMKSTFPTYFMEVGISYFSIPVISIAMGLLLRRNIKA